MARKSVQEELARTNNKAAYAEIKPALRDMFSRYPTHCDHCNCAIVFPDLVRYERSTAAGSFKYVLCVACDDKMFKMNRAAENRAVTRAIIRHAARYSIKFAEFVADWYGVKMPRRLPGCAA